MVSVPYYYSWGESCVSCVLCVVSSVLTPMNAFGQSQYIDWFQDNLHCVADVGPENTEDPATEDYGTTDFYIGSLTTYGIYQGTCSYKYGVSLAPEKLDCYLETPFVDFIYPVIDSASIRTKTPTTQMHGFGPWWGPLIPGFWVWVGESVVYDSTLTIKCHWVMSIGNVQVSPPGSETYTQRLMPNMLRRSWTGTLLLML